MKSFLSHLLLSIITLVFLLLCLELVFRTARKDDALKLSMGRVDAKYHHTFEPHSKLHMVSQFPGEFDVTAHINNYGFRGPEMSLAKRPNAKRIFAIGDSYTFGVGAKDAETIPAQLQKRLDPSRESFEVINAGRGNTSPLIYYLRLREEIPRFKPDLVVMFFDFSDLWEDWNFEKNLVYDSQGQIVGLNPYYEYGKFRVWNFLRANSVLASYLHNKVVRTYLQIRKIGFKRYLRAILEGKKVKAVIATTEDETIEFDGRIFLRGSEKKKEITEHFKRTSKYILLCRDLVLKDGARFILVVYPYGIQVGPNQWAKGRVSWGFEEGKTYRDNFSFDLLENFSKQNEIPFINLREDLVRHADQKLYFSYDGHFTPGANEVVADALVRHPVFREGLGLAPVIFKEEAMS